MRLLVQVELLLYTSLMQALVSIRKALELCQNHICATANALRYEGANVQFCDVEPETGLIQLNPLKNAYPRFPKNSWNKKTHCPRFFCGFRTGFKSCRKLADKKNFTVEDASHSRVHGMKINQ